MPCFHPIAAHQERPGAPLSFSKTIGRGRRVEVPCGRCIGCRLEYARQWALRCVHEASLFDENAFVTLTYDAAHLPADLSLRYRDVQLFLKRLRKRHKVRFYVCGEYGESRSRPHYHILLFGFYPKDCVYYAKSNAGFTVYTSAYMDDVWSCGTCYVGQVTFESAGYCARYVMKKVGSDGAEREIFDPSTGEIIRRAHEFCRMSNKPFKEGASAGIGGEWFDRFGLSDVYPHDRVVIRGKECKPPRYYDKLYEGICPDILAKIKEARLVEADKRFEDSFPKRLRVREQVTEAAVQSLKRVI